MPMVWDDAADKKLLMAALAVSDVKINYDEVAKALSTEDNVVTAKAVNVRYSKLRVAAKEGQPNKATTPTATGGEGKATPRGRKKKTTTTEAEDDANGSPKKKQRKPKVKAAPAPVIKDEEEGNDEGNDEGDDEEAVAEAMESIFGHGITKFEEE